MKLRKTRTFRHVNLINYHTHTRLTALFPGLPGWASTRKVKPIWILLKQETVSGSGISWAIYKSAPRSRQTTTPAPHHSVFYRPDAFSATQPTVSKHWRHYKLTSILIYYNSLLIESQHIQPTRHKEIEQKALKRDDDIVCTWSVGGILWPACNLYVWFDVQHNR